MYNTFEEAKLEKSTIINEFCDPKNMDTFIQSKNDEMKDDTRIDFNNHKLVFE